jgi:cell division protease FtsH
LSPAHILSRSSRSMPASNTDHDTDSLSADHEVAQSPPPELLDPAKLAARLLLIRALEETQTDFAIAGADGAIVLVKVPVIEWVEPAYAVWCVAARSGKSGKNGYQRPYHGSRLEWSAWVADEPQGDHALATAADSFAVALAAGQHCAAFASDLAWLPSDIAVSADYTLTMPQLNGRDVAAVARGVCGDEPAAVIPDEYAAQLTPRLLRLGRRRNQTADQYLIKLSRLIESDRARSTSGRPAPSPSVREAPTLARLHGMDQAVEWGMALARDLKQVREGEIGWEDVDRGCLLSGPPGTGKTLFARALAATCGVPLISGSYSEWHGSGGAHQGDLLKAMKKTFKTARENAPSILFIDEVDSFPNRATITHRYVEWETQVVNALLAEIDGVEARDGVVLVAACNHPSKLDPALTRSGRLDRHIRIGPPNPEALVAILREHLGGDLESENLMPAAIAANGSTGADAERFVRGARRRARKDGRPVTFRDLLAEIGGSDDLSSADLWIVAVHEAGHAVVCCELAPGMLKAVTLNASKSHPGATSRMFPSVFLTVDSIRQRLVVMLAGRAAEEVILGAPSSGAGGEADCDLARASRLATASTASLGLDPDFGLVWLGPPDGPALARLAQKVPGLGARVKEAIHSAYSDALDIVRRRTEAVTALAKALVDRRALAGSDAESLVAQFPGGESGDGRQQLVVGVDRT